LDQVQVLFDAARGTPYFIPTLLAVHGGFRRGEVLRLKWDDVNLETGVVTIRTSKTGRGRSVGLPPSARVELTRHKGEQSQFRLLSGDEYEDHGLVYPREDGKPRSLACFSDCYSEFIGRLVKRLGLPKITFHGLRHTHATLMLGEGIHPKIVSERLGHANI